MKFLRTLSIVALMLLPGLALGGVHEAVKSKEALNAKSKAVETKDEAGALEKNLGKAGIKQAAMAGKRGAVAKKDLRKGAADGLMQVQVFRGAGVSNRILAIGEIGFSNAQAVGSLPQGDAQWEGYWQSLREAYRLTGTQGNPHPENQHAQLRARWYVESCKQKNQAAFGPIAQGGVNAQGQRWAKVAVRAVELATETVDGCVVQRPEFTELHFEGVLDSNPEQVFVVERDGAVYTFRFLALGKR